MTKHQVKTKTKTSTAVGVALLAVAGLAAAAAIAMAALPPKLTVRLVNTVTSATYTKGATADMIGIALTASSGPAVVSSLTFHVLADDDASFATVENDLTASDFISSCSLYDSNNVLTSGPEPINSSGALTFNALVIGIGRGRTQTYKVSCNLANVTTASSDDDIYALTINSDSDVSVSRANGTAMTGRNLDIGNISDSGINLNGSSVAITVNNNGTLTASLDGTSPSPDIILGNSTGVLAGVWGFASTNEPFEIDKMTITNSGHDEVANAVRLTCTNVSGITVTNTGYFSNGSVLFANLDCYIPNNSYSTISVSIDTNQVSSSGATSGDTIQLSFADTNFEAVGLSSGVSIEAGDLATPVINASEMILRKTKPTIALANGSPSGSGVPGLNEVLRFGIAADSRGYVTVDELTFKLTSVANAAGSTWNVCDTDGSLGSANGLDDADFSLYEIDDLSSAIEGSDSDWMLLDGADLTVECTKDTDVVDFAILDLTTPQEVAAGSYNVYSLYLDTTGASAVNDDSIRVDLPSNSEVATNYGTDPDGTIIWEDDSGTTEIDGTYVENLPVYGGTITY
jgi:hypothetical protein